MENLNVFDKKAYGQIEGFRIASGIVAIIAAIYYLYNFLRLIQLIGYGINYIINIDIFAQILMIISMIACVVYVFSFYGKKQSSLLGVSAIALTGAFVLLGVNNILVYKEYSEYLEGGSQILSFYIFNSILNILIGLIFLFIGLKYFNKIKASIKILPILAISITLLSIIIRCLVFEFIQITIIVDSLYIVPFLLFLLFCPPHHKRVKINVPNSQLQEKIIGDLNSQLLYLKNEFENGRITKQEYDYKRKSLIDSL